MDLIISARNFTLTPRLKAFASRKFAKLAHFWRRIIRVRVELSVEATRSHDEANKVDALVKVPGPDIRAEFRATNIPEAIDLVIPKLERQISRAKGKYDVHKKRRGLTF